MLKSGHVLCHVCGKVFTDACYGSSKHRDRLILKQTLFQEFFLEPLNSKTDVKYQLMTGKAELGDGMPDFIEVKADNEVVGFTRCCPHCSTLTFMPRYWGTVPSYVVTVAAMPGEGKTCLYRAMATDFNLSNLASAGYPWHLSASQMPLGTDNKPARTTLDSTGATNFFEIRAKGDSIGNGPPRAMILFRDSPGELFDAHAADPNHAFFQFLRKHDHYPGPDALIFLHSAEKSDDTLLDVYNTLHGRITRWPYTAVVITHVDKVDKWTQQAGDGTQVILMDKSTFPVCLTYDMDYYKPDLVEQRRALQDYIVRSRYHRMFNKDFNVIGSRNQCFLVKSCHQEADGELNYSQPINVMDPVIWLVNNCLFQEEVL